MNVECADVWGETLLIGTDEGLYAYELDASDSKLTSISSRSYSQMDSIPEFNILVSRSGEWISIRIREKTFSITQILHISLMILSTGKYDVISIHDLTTVTKFIDKKRKKVFETETKIKKMKETKGCEFYSIARSNRGVNSIYLCVAMPKSVLIMKWAPHPFNKFMVFKVKRKERNPLTLCIFTLSQN